MIINSYWTRRWRVFKFIHSRQVISNEGLPELDSTWWDWINLLSVIIACNNCFIIPKKTNTLHILGSLLSLIDQGFKFRICITSHLYLFVEQLCFCLHSTASFFVNSIAMVLRVGLWVQSMKIIQPYDPTLHCNP